MTNKEKLVLLQKDLCARLPYGVMCRIKTRFVFDDGTVRKGTRDEILDLDTVTEIESWYDANEIEKLKPYLRSLSSMTEEEALKVVELRVCNPKDVLSVSVKQDCISVEIDDGVAGSETHTIWFNEIVTSIELVDWLNSRHFDYRGLIEKGLALEAPEGMYDIK